MFILITFISGTSEFDHWEDSDIYDTEYLPNDLQEAIEEYLTSPDYKEFPSLSLDFDKVTPVTEFPVLVEHRIVVYI